MNLAEWTKIGSLDSISKGKLVPIEVNGIKMILVSGNNTRIVIPKSCPHMESSLEEGVFDGITLTCTKHLWQWHIDEGGKAIGMAEVPLLTYETKEIDGDLYVKALVELKYEHET
jgi:toluene monooxygenase system ferredoxin subunit